MSHICAHPETPPFDGQSHCPRLAPQGLGWVRPPPSPWLGMSSSTLSKAKGGGVLAWGFKYIVVVEMLFV